jgi:hypothetical protein
MYALITTPANWTNTWTWGARMPTTNNNDLCIVDDWSAEGVWYSLIFGEHTHVRDMRSIYCGWGVMLDQLTTTPHVAHIDYASIELCQNTMGLLGTTAVFKIDADLIDTESPGFIWDGNSAIQGQIVIGSNVTAGKGSTSQTERLDNIIGNWSGTPTNGSLMRLIGRDVLPGAIAPGNAPAVPAASADRWNNLMRDAVVNIVGGTSVAVSVDGQATGLTTPCTVIIPAGKKINLGAYTGSPTWNWVLL